jgi:response regulator RpfG family c-di-GMP phosphodiesterase
MFTSPVTQTGPQLQPTILIVDDDPGVLCVMRRIVSRDARVLQASCAEDALALLQDNEPDVVISDYRMPGLTGIELMEVVRRSVPEAVRVLVSANCDVESTAGAVNGGLISRFVLKPWREEELETVVHLALRDRQLLRQTRAAAEDLARVEEQLRLVPAAGDVAPLLRSLRELLQEHEHRIAWGA